MRKIIFNLFIISIISIMVVGCGKKQQPMDLYDVIQQRGKLVVGVSKNIKPFGYVDSKGEAVGFEIELAKQIANLILNNSKAIEFVNVEPANRISMLNSGQADMIISTMTVNSQRLNVVDFSEPYYIAGQTVMVLKNSKIKSLSDLKDKKIGVAFGTTAYDGIKTIAPSAIITGFKTYDEAVDALKTGSIDAFASDDTILIGYAINNKAFRILNQKYTHEPYGIAFRKGTESTRVLSLVNQKIKTMNNNGSMNQLKNKWLNY